MTHKLSTLDHANLEDQPTIADVSTEDMPMFYVTLRLYIGGYEKCVSTFRRAANSDDAEYDALCGETHNEPLTRQQFDDGDEWWDDYMIYKIDSVERVPQTLAQAVKEHDQWPLRLIY